MTNDQILFVLARAAEKSLDDRRVNFDPGVHPINQTFLVTLKGGVKKNKDYERAPTALIPLKRVLALCLQRAGFQREAIAEILIQAMTTAIKNDTYPNNEIAELVNDIEAAEGRVKELIKQLPKVPASGATAVTVQIEVEEVPQGTAIPSDSFFADLCQPQVA